MIFKDLTDRELVKAFQGGNEEAFCEIVTRYKEKAMQIAMLTTGSWEDAKDASQEAFVKVHRALDKFEFRSEFSTWFYRILKNAALDLIRKRKWQRFLKFRQNDEMKNFFESVSDPHSGPDQQLLSSELGMKMTETIKKLPFQQQWMFTLRYLKGFSIQQIADVAEVSEGTVKATLHFAAAKFKKELFPYLGEEGLS